MARIVVCGLGFAGLEALRYLTSLGVCDRHECVVVAPTDRFEFLPALPELVAGRIGVHDVSWHVGSWLKENNVFHVVGRVVSVRENKLGLEDGEKLDYDYLLVAWGAEPSFYGIPGARENSIPLYSVENSLRLRRFLERARSLAIVGAGLVGSELAAEVATAHERFPNLEKIVIVDALDEPLKLLGNRRGSRLVRKVLQKLGIELMLGKPVMRVEPGKLYLRGGGVIEADVIAWCTGVKARTIDADNLKIDERGYLVIDSRCRVEGGRDRVYAAGDASSYVKAGCTALKMVREALRQAKVAAYNIAAALGLEREKRYKPLITSCKPAALVVMGPSNTVFIYGKRVAFNIALLQKYKVWWLRRFRERYTKGC